MSFFFDNDYIVEQLAMAYRDVFAQSVEAVAVFETEKQAIATFCFCYGKQALDLVNDCPALAFLVATTNFYQYGDERRFSGRCLLPAEKRTRILESYGFSGVRFVAICFVKFRLLNVTGSFFMT